MSVSFIIPGGTNVSYGIGVHAACQQRCSVSCASYQYSSPSYQGENGSAGGGSFSTPGTTSQQVTVVVNIQHSPDGQNWSDSQQRVESYPSPVAPMVRVSSEDGTDNDWNDLVLQFSWRAPGA